jgi:hypothetical protein
VGDFVFVFVSNENGSDRQNERGNMSEQGSTSERERFFVYGKPGAYLVGQWLPPNPLRWLNRKDPFEPVAGPFREQPTAQKALLYLKNHLGDDSPEGARALGARLTAALAPKKQEAVRQEGGDEPDPTKWAELMRGIYIRRRFLRCGKSRCTRCPHGPYFYVSIRGYGRQRRELSLGKNPTKRDFYRKLSEHLTTDEIRTCVRAWSHWTKALADGQEADITTNGKPFAEGAPNE